MVIPRRRQAYCQLITACAKEPCQRFSPSRLTPSSLVLSRLVLIGRRLIITVDFSKPPLMQRYRSSTSCHVLLQSFLSKRSGNRARSCQVQAQKMRGKVKWFMLALYRHISTFPARGEHLDEALFIELETTDSLEGNVSLSLCSSRISLHPALKP